MAGPHVAAWLKEATRAGAARPRKAQILTAPPSPEEAPPWGACETQAPPRGGLHRLSASFRYIVQPVENGNAYNITIFGVLQAMRTVMMQALFQSGVQGLFGRPNQ